MGDNSGYGSVANGYDIIDDGPPRPPVDPNVRQPGQTASTDFMAPPQPNILDQAKMMLMSRGMQGMTEAQAYEAMLADQVARRRRIAALKDPTQAALDNFSDAGEAVSRGVASPPVFTEMSPADIVGSVAAGQQAVQERQRYSDLVLRDRAHQKAIDDVYAKLSAQTGRTVIPPRELWPEERGDDPNMQTLPNANPQSEFRMDDTGHIHPAAPYQPMPDVDPTFQRLDNHVQQHGWSPALFQDSTPEEAMAMIAGQLTEHRKKVMGEFDPSLIPWTSM